jgi:hypothetical protein
MQGQVLTYSPPHWQRVLQGVQQQEAARFSCVKAFEECKDKYSTVLTYSPPDRQRVLQELQIIVFTPRSQLL